MVLRNNSGPRCARTPGFSLSTMIPTPKTPCEKLRPPEINTAPPPCANIANLVPAARWTLRRLGAWYARSVALGRHGMRACSRARFRGPSSQDDLRALGRSPSLRFHADVRADAASHMIVAGNRRGRFFADDPPRRRPYPSAARRMRSGRASSHRLALYSALMIHPSAHALP